MAEEAQEASPEGETTTDPVRRLTYIAVGVCAFLAFWYIVGDRITPSTSQARVWGYTVPIVSQVEISGTSSFIKLLINDVSDRM